MNLKFSLYKWFLLLFVNPMINGTTKPNNGFKIKVNDERYKFWMLPI